MCVLCVFSNRHTMAANFSEAEAEISQLKDTFGQDCHVIRDVGDFSHVVSISFKKWCVTLKFQITGIICSE